MDFYFVSTEKIVVRISIKFYVFLSDEQWSAQKLKKQQKIGPTNENSAKMKTVFFFMKATI